VVLGIAGWAPVAGVAWQALHYLEGFRRLGYDVYYVEDTGAWPYDPVQNAVTADCRYSVDFLRRLMRWCGLGDRWAYRSAAMDGRLFGLSESELSRLYAGADALVNLTGATVLREEHLTIPVRVYLETDPVQPQIDVARGRQPMIDLLAGHTHHFTFGENLGAPDCPLPSGPFTYRPTRQPIVMEWWRSDSRSLPDDRAPFTTIATWRQSNRDVEWQGQVYTWSKHHEFLKLVDLPRRVARPLELALARADSHVIDHLHAYGWRVRDALAISRDIFAYHDYLVSSGGEFTVAKDQNIRLRSGWFSDRSACYLAAGRPVITQETGFSKFLPTGKGLFAFRSLDEAAAAGEAIAADYAGHCRAAGDIAAEYFAAESVLQRLADHVGL
jgi:hypothetical protein